MTKPLKFSRDNLSIMLQVKEEHLEDLEHNLTGTKLGMLECFTGNPPEQLYPVIVEPIVANLKDDDSAKEFAKLLVLAKRLTLQIETTRKELMVLQSLLDEQSPLMIAATNFDELEVKSD